MSAAQLPSPSSILDGKYALLREIASGSAGTVYEAENRSIGKKVAVKLLNPRAFADQDDQARYISRARAAARVSHANLADVLDLGVSKEGAPYVVMELLRGETLQELVDSRGPLAPGYACELLLQVLAGLSAAHAQGVLHLDLKPSHVMVTHPRPDRPLVKLLDLGSVATPSARPSPTSADVPLYGAPEQLQGAPLDCSTDVYQATALLLALLAGVDPFERAAPGGPPKNVAKGCEDLQALRPDLPRELIAVIHGGMARTPQERIRSADELAERLRPFASQTRWASLAPEDERSSRKGLALIVTPTPDVSKVSALPALQASVIPIHMPRVARVRDSLLLSPQIPRAPSPPKLRAGQDFMPLPGDPDYTTLVEGRRSQTRIPERRGKFRRDVLPALMAMGIGFGLGVVLAWSAGLL